jgi:site-specific recombinase XerD
VKPSSFAEEYIQYLADSRRRSPNTIESYQNDLRQYGQFLCNPGPNPFETSGLSMLAGADLSQRIVEATPQTVQLFCDFLKAKFYASATIARKCAAVEGFYKYLQKAGHIRQNPFADFQFVKPKTQGRVCLDDSHITKLVESIPDNHWLGVRDKTVVALLYATGIKVGELLRLTLTDYSAQEQSLSIHKPGGKTRKVAVSDRAAVLLHEYILVRSLKSENSGTPTELLFLNRDCSPITVRSIRRKLKEYGKKAGLPSKVTPEVIRRSYAVKILKQGVSVEQLAHQLGYLSVAAFKQQLELNEPQPAKDRK